MLAKVWKISLILLLISALAVPGAYAEVSANERAVFESLSVLVIDGEQTISAQDAVVLRHGMDAYGNNDSHVSAMEVTSFEATYEDFVKEYGNEYTLNGISGQFTDLTATFKDATGPTDSGAPILYEYNGRIGFAGVDEDLDSFRFRIVNEGGGLNNTMFITVGVPDGYEVTDTDGILAAEISGKNNAVSGQTITDANVVVDFAPIDEWGWIFPYLLLSGLISAIIVAVLAIIHFRGGGDEQTFQEAGGAEEQPQPKLEE